MLALIGILLSAVIFTGEVEHVSLFSTAPKLPSSPAWAKIDHFSNSYATLGLRTSFDKPNPVGYRGMDAALRLEFTRWPLLGYDAGFGGYGPGHIHVGFDFKWGDVTVGDFYEQFGSGLILRLYEERTLGIDNALRGLKVHAQPYKGIDVTVLGGKQRRYWSQYADGAFGFNYSRDAVVGADINIDVAEWSDYLQQINAHITFGASWVSKYEKRDSLVTVKDGGLYKYVEPRWVGAVEGRFGFQMQNWDLRAEYAYKSNDPSVNNHYSYAPGYAGLLSLSYSRMGFSFIIQAKRTSNMYFRSERSRTDLAGHLNHLPAFTSRHTYELATLYPYNTQILGEMGFQGELRYTAPRKSKVGGQYGTTFVVSAAHLRGLHHEGEYYTEVCLEFNKQLTKQWYIAALLMYQGANLDVIQGHGGMMRGGLGVFEAKWRINSNFQLRGEVQYLYTPHYEGQWFATLWELSLYKHWMIFGQYSYNIGYAPEATHDHCCNAGFSWTHKAHRLTAAYMRTNDGYVCVGGVCRYVPAQQGVNIQYSYAW